MKSLSEFICKPHGGVRYNNSKEISGKKFFLNTDADDHKYSNRYAEVIEVPSGYNGVVQKGDILLVHHNVFKFYTGSKGRNMSGKSFLDADLFLIDHEQFYAYKRDGNWTPMPKYSFVKPVKHSPGISMEMTGNTPLHGEVWMATEEVQKKGAKVGSVIIFTPESEYEFDIDGTIVYRIINSDMAVVL